ncbi:hypothetical protein AV274_6561 [Blastocystis sp. ATCC 50177/Nand II]|uniref:Uncharacterized protein n=1 Tax=Blastocystis sp. subtype 1 (strain ATCC 50177 / NandII) TaxID=478820 RepID=A0A196S5M6_BLAHN|nr:hypothetical protein AV274_6561 [Blastocystis sp. ATCC 50177/Nand II]
MISLVPYEESSDSSDESEVEEKKPEVKKTDETAKVEKQPVPEKQKTVIPSFDEAFNSTSDFSFVGKKNTEKKTAIKFFNVNEGIKKGAMSMQEIEEEKARKEAEEKAEKEKGKMKEMEREEKERIDRVLKEREMSDELYRLKREGKEIFKEKMKRQRLKGQSGIGDHFRTWRSEAEMKMRQEYM